MGKIMIKCICGKTFRGFSSKAENHKTAHPTHIQKIEVTFDVGDHKPFEAFAAMDFKGFSEHAFSPDSFLDGDHFEFK